MLSSMRNLLVVIALFAIGFADASPARAVTFIPITNDADSGISNAKVYTHAIDFGSQSTYPLATVNGVAFTNGFPAGKGSTTIPTAHAGGPGSNVTGNVGNLFGDMVYNNINGKVTLNGLIIGQTYDLRFYNRQWSAFDRTQRFDYDVDGVGGPDHTVTVNPDNALANPPGLDAANRANAMSFTYTARSTQMTVDITQLGSGTYHMYGLTNELTGPTVAMGTWEPLSARIFSSGVDYLGRVLTPGTLDPHYTTTSVPAANPFVTPGAAIVQSNHGAWLANDAVGTVGSSFISTTSVGTNAIAGGAYVTSTTFSLAGINPSTVSIAAAIAADNNVNRVLLNGVQIAGAMSSSFNSWSSFNIPAGSNFNAGNNTLTFEWSNADAVSGPGGLRVELNAIGMLDTKWRLPIPGLFNTGVDNNGTVLPNDSAAIDPHYQINLNPNGGGPSAHVENQGAFPIVAGPWLANNANSKWIAPAFDTGSAAAGTYEYTTTFDLTGFLPETATLSGFWASDDAGSAILLNGIVVANGNVGFGTLVPFTIPVGSPFVDGINTLTFRLGNSSVGYTGLRVEGLQGSAINPIPEPASVTLLVAGAMALIRRRKRA